MYHVVGGGWAPGVHQTMPGEGSFGHMPSVMPKRVAGSVRHWYPCLTGSVAHIYFLILEMSSTFRLQISVMLLLKYMARTETDSALNLVTAIALKGLSCEMQGGQKWAQTMRTDKLYNRFTSFFSFKETP